MDNQEFPQGKRKKKVASCANKLFVYWVKELRDDAAEKGLKTQYVYGKVSCIFYNPYIIAHD